MDQKNFINVIEKEFSVDDNQTTTCNLVCEVEVPFSLKKMNNFMSQSFVNELHRKDIIFFDSQSDRFIFKTSAEVSLKHDDVYDKSTGEKLAYLKAKVRSVEKARKLYKWINAKLLPQYIEYMRLFEKNATNLSQHISDYLTQLKKID